MILIFTGHMIDAEGRSAERYPPWLEPSVAEEIHRVVRKLAPSTGYSSAACGGDIQFLEAIVAIGNQPTIVLPFPREDFVDTSIAFAGNDWTRRFEKLVQSDAPLIEITDDPFLGEDDLYDYGFEVMLGMALKEGERLGESVKVLAALDGGSQSIAGGTKAMLDKLRPRGVEVIEIDVGRLRDKFAGDRDSWIRPVERLPTPARRSTRVPEDLKYDRIRRTMLFADVQGFGKLSEVQSPAFFIHFLEAVRTEIERSEIGPIFSNTWGDGLYLVFEDIAPAAEFALRLCRHVRDADWVDKGLPQDLAVRIGMHTGPVFRAHDPIINDVNWFGAHVNRAARIEPMAAPNSVWCSQQAAAVLKAQLIPGYQTVLMGELSLPKGAGTVPLYELIRTT